MKGRTARSCIDFIGLLLFVLGRNGTCRLFAGEDLEIILSKRSLAVCELVHKMRNCLSQADSYSSRTVSPHCHILLKLFSPGKLNTGDSILPAEDLWRSSRRVGPREAFGFLAGESLNWVEAGWRIVQTWNILSQWEQW
jgi:hypothetical protein